MAHAKGEQTKQRILTAALDLLENQGFHNTGLQQIIAESGAPKGSLYFHFPQGKDEIAAMAIRQGADTIKMLMEQAFNVADTPKQAVDFMIKGLSMRLEESGYQKGCPVATVALEVGSEHPSVQQACAAAYESWTLVIVEGLKAFGMRKPQAEKEALLALSMIEGGLMMAKVQKSCLPLEEVGKGLVERLEVKAK